MALSIVESCALGAGVVGALVLGHKSQKLAEKRGGSKTEQLMAGAVGTGLAVAIPPIAVGVGLVAVSSGVVYAVKHRGDIVQKAKDLGAHQKRRAQELYSSVRRGAADVDTAAE